MAESEAGLFAGLRDGDQDAYLEIYNKYHARLYHYILKYVKVPELAEDVLHDIFLKLWEVRAQIKPELAGTGYLYRISRNYIFKLMKKIATDEELRRRVVTAISELAAEGSDETLEWREYSGLLNHAIEHLPPQRRKIFQLCRMEGKSYKEAAEILGISHNTVKEHMVHAMKFIKEYFYKNTDIVLGLLILNFTHMK